MSQFGDTLQELRIESGLTQLQVAERVGVSNAYISALESGRKPAPPYAIVSAMAAALTVDEEPLWDVASAEREDRRPAGCPPHPVQTGDRSGCATHENRATPS